MENQVMRAVKPLIDYLLGFRYRLETGAAIDHYALRRDILATLQTVEGTIKSSPALHMKSDLIRYIMVGFADEVVLSSTWANAKEWREKLLEMELFRTSVAGERFFDFLERDGYRDPEIAELFFVCLVLGFRGKYRTREEEIRTIKQRVYAVLPVRLPEDERRLTPGADAAVTTGEKMLPRIFGYVTVAVVLVVSLVGYFVVSQMMWNEIAETIHSISKSLSLN